MDLQVVINEYEELEKNELAIAQEKELVLKKHEEVFKAIVKLDEEANSLVAKKEEVKAKLMEAMDAVGVKKFENDFIAITYVEPTTKTTLDTKALKDELPDIYEQYSKTSSVKGYLKIKTKEVA